LFDGTGTGFADGAGTGFVVGAGTGLFVGTGTGLFDGTGTGFVGSVIIWLFVAPGTGRGLKKVGFGCGDFLVGVGVGLATSM